VWAVSEACARASVGVCRAVSSAGACPAVCSAEVPGGMVCTSWPCLRLQSGSAALLCRYSHYALQAKPIRGYDPLLRCFALKQSIYGACASRRKVCTYSACDLRSLRFVYSEIHIKKRSRWAPFFVQQVRFKNPFAFL